MYGFCYEHGRDLDISFTSFEHVELLVQDGKLCIPMENTIACSNNSVKANAQVVAALLILAQRMKLNISSNYFRKFLH